MKNNVILSCLALAACSAVMLSACSDKESLSSNQTTSVTTVTTTSAPVTEPIVPLPEVPEKEEVNPTPATYESVGADRTAKEDFNKSISESCEIPVISVTTKNGENIVSLKDYVSCVVDVLNGGEEYSFTEASAGIRVRGNSSAFYGDVNEILKNTVPYRIKFDVPTNLLGLHDGAECKSWVLLKSDWDLIRNDIALRMGRAIFDGDNYCSDGRLVHLYVNEKFQGIYFLCEQNQVNKNRVDVSEVEKGYMGTDIGYYLELDNYAMSEEDNHYITLDYCQGEYTDIEGETRKFVPAEYSIKNDLYSQNQIDFIQKYMTNIFTIVYEACKNDNYLTFDENYNLVEADFTTAEETVSQVMDIDSVVDMYILYEIIHDYDCGEGSFYMCVDFSENSKYEKLTFTSPWDFNWAYNDAPEGKYYAAAFADKSFVDQYGDRSNPWFIILMQEDWFQNAVKEKWTEMKKDDVLKNCILEEKRCLKNMTRI